MLKVKVFLFAACKLLISTLALYLIIYHTFHVQPPPPHIQSKQNLEKAKHNLDVEKQSLEQDLREMTTSFQESDKRRKNTESALSEAQSRITEDTSKIQELSSQNARMSVSAWDSCMHVIVLRVCILFAGMQLTSYMYNKAKYATVAIQVWGV